MIVHQVIDRHRAEIAALCRRYEVTRLEVFGSGGMLLAGNQRATTVELSNAQETGAQDVLLNTFIQRYADAYAAEVGHFVDCLQSGTTPLTNFSDGIEALRIAEAAVESMEKGTVVKLA